MFNHTIWLCNMQLKWATAHCGCEEHAVRYKSCESNIHWVAPANAIQQAPDHGVELASIIPAAEPSKNPRLEVSPVEHPDVVEPLDQLLYGITWVSGVPT